MYSFRFWPNMTPGVRSLIIVNVSVFILQCLIDFGITRSHTIMQNHIFAYFSLTPQSILDGFVWQLFTYQFLHGGAYNGLFHLLINMFIFWNFGAELEEKWGTRFFIQYYLVCGFGAGIFIFLIPVILGQSLFIPTVGASGAIFGLLLAFAIYWPERYILWFFIPIKTKYFILIVGLFSLLFTFQATGGGISHVGHLGGLITGYLYLLYKMNDLISGTKIYHSYSQVNFLKKFWGKFKEARKKKEREERQREIHDELHMEEKVDDLLAKISKYGMKSLTAKEKKFLKKASGILENSEANFNSSKLDVLKKNTEDNGVV